MKRKFDDKATWRTEFGRDAGIDTSQPAAAERVFDPNDSITDDPTRGGIAGSGQADTHKITTATGVMYTDQQSDPSLAVDHAYVDFKAITNSFAALTTSLTGANNDLVYTAVTIGAYGNQITVAYVNPGTASASLSTSVTGTAITVNLATDAGTAATGTITTSGTGAALNDTVTIGATTYTFKTSLTGAANEVLRDGTIDHDLTNLKAAINGAAGAGTTYGTGTVANTSVSAGTITSHVLTLTALSVGTAGNSIVLTKTGAVLTVSGSGTLSGGVNPAITSTASQVKTNVLASAPAALLVSVANASGNDGSGTVTALTATHLTGGTASLADAS
jgi:hypothetical protein